MALINCPDCGKQVSSLADKCPDCAYPINPKVDPPLQIQQPALRNCFECGGSGKVPIECPDCKGSGRRKCPSCGGAGCYFMEMDEIQDTCSVCDGTGTRPCDRCQGTCMIPGGAKCTICGGSGQLTHEEYEVKQQIARRQEEESRCRAQEAAQQAEAEAVRQEAENASRRMAVSQTQRKEGNRFLGRVMSCLFVIIELLFMGTGIVLAINGLLGSPGSLILGVVVFGIGAISNLVRWKRAMDKKQAETSSINYLDFGQQRLAWTAENSPAHLDK